MTVKFFVAGMRILIVDWLNDGCKDDPLEIATVIVGIRNNTKFC